MTGKANERWQIAQRAEEEGWERWKVIRPDYKKQLEEYWHQYIEQIAKYFKFVPEHKLLDIGCGPDGMINYIPTGHRYGLDPLMETYLSRFEMPHDIEWKTGTIEEIPFSDGFFDLITCTNAIDHALRPDEGLKEIYRALKRDGYLVLTVNCYAPLRRLLRKIKERLGRGDKEHPYSLSRQEVRDLIKKSGLNLLVDYEGIGTMGVWFYERNPNGSYNIINKAKDLMFRLEGKIFGYSCIDFVFIARKS